MSLLSALLAALLSRLTGLVAGKAVTISVDAALAAVAAGCGLWLWYGTPTSTKVLAGVLAADQVALYLALTGRLPFVSGLFPKKAS